MKATSPPRRNRQVTVVALFLIEVGTTVTGKDLNHCRLTP
jgi:hypothetical protein